jgi:hypothetical protein
MNICSISSAGNTENPCLLVLRDKGYRFEIFCKDPPPADSPACIYVAHQGDRRFSGNSAAELLGLVALWEHFGDDWNRQQPDVMTEAIVLVSPEAERDEDAAADN